jgi:hypothetical protein
VKRAGWLLLWALGCAQGGGSDDPGEDEEDLSGVTAASGQGGASGTGAAGQGGAGASGAGASGAGVSGASTGAGAGGASSASSGASSGSSTGATSVSASGATASASSSGSGGASADPWLQIEYGSSSTPTSPSWTFSPTPGWKGQDWAYQGDSWPEVWDVYNSIQVKFDPMGAYAAIIDPGDTLQLMLGFGKLQSYQDVVVQLEGRGYATSSSGVFDVYNPLNNCGASGVTMAHDWSIHVVQVSLAGCILTGNATQAVRVKPTQNGLALVRLKVTLVGAVY